VNNDELVQWIAHAPEAERIREALCPSLSELLQNIKAFEAMNRYDHRHIARRKVRKACRHD